MKISHVVMVVMVAMLTVMEESGSGGGGDSYGDGCLFDSKIIFNTST